MNNFKMQELEYIRVQLVCLLVNAKQAHKISSLIRTIESLQGKIDTESEG